MLLPGHRHSLREEGALCHLHSAAAILRRRSECRRLSARTPSRLPPSPNGQLTQPLLQPTLPQRHPRVHLRYGFEWGKQPEIIVKGLLRTPVSPFSFFLQQEVTYVDRVRAVCAILKIGNAHAADHRPTAQQAAMAAIKTGVAFRANPFAVDAETYLPTATSTATAGARGTVPLVAAVGGEGIVAS